MPRSSLFRLRVVLILLTVSTAPVRAAAWLKLQTPDVVIYSDASARDVVEFAVGYAAYRHVFQELFAPPNRPPAATVLLFRRLGTLQQHLPKPEYERSEAVSYSCDVDGRALLALAVGGDRDLALEQTFQFETIWLLDRCGYYVPIWMSQGAGEVLQSLHLKKNTVLVGPPANDLFSGWSNSRDLPWKRFFGITTSSPEYAGRDAKGLFHAQAWALMHRILLGGGDAAGAFGDLAAKLKTMEPLDAVERTLAVPVAQFDRDINRHLSTRGRNREFPFDADSLRKQLAPQPAVEAEVSIQISNLLFATGKTNEAELELARAQVLAPDAPALKEARARGALREGQRGEAARLYREAIASGSASAMAYLRSAEQRLDEVSSGGMDHAGQGGRAAADAVIEIRKALALDPGLLDAYRLLGRALFLMPDVTAEQVEELGPGVSRGAAGSRVRLYRALVYDRLGRTADYISDLRAVAEDSLSEPRVREIVAQRLARAGAPNAGGTN